jgi:trans-aconitate methyltransferase
MSKYEKSYFHTGNYRFYMQAGPRYIRMARELISLLSSINLIKADSKILDFGCGVGFFLEGLKSFHSGELTGYDISQWALNECKRKNLDVIFSIQEMLTQTYNLAWFLDVLEHMPEHEINEVLSKLSTDLIAVRIPVSLNEGEAFHLEVSNNDETHITCHSKEWWNLRFHKFGYKLFFTFNLASIYDSDGVYCAMFKKCSTGPDQ